MPSRILAGGSPKLRDLVGPFEHATPEPPGSKTKVLLVLETGNGTGVPSQVRRPLMYVPVTELPPTPRATSNEKSVNSEVAREDEAPVGSDVDWVKAYDIFFRMVCKHRHGLNKKDFGVAFTPLESVVAVAESLDAIPGVQEVIQSLFFLYIGKHTFWETISRYPLRCLKLARALKNVTLYEEALKHLVGGSASREDSVPYPGLAEPLYQIIESKAQQLRSMKMKIDMQLLCLTLPSKQSDGKVPVDMQQPVSWTAVNLYRDWVAEHITYLRSESTTLAPSNLCQHHCGCTDTAGFYSLLAAEGDDYMNPDKVLADWDTAKFPRKIDSTVRSVLLALKRKAAELVAPLVESTLQLPDKHKLQYLTCVRVGKGDNSWRARG